MCVLLNFYHTFIEAPHPKCCLMNFSAIKPHPRTPKSTPPLPLLHHPVAHFTKNISSWTKISFNSHPSVSKAIATKYCTCHDSTAVVACAKICSDVIPKNEIIAKLISYPPGISSENFQWHGPQLRIIVHPTVWVIGGESSRRDSRQRVWSLLKPNWLLGHSFTETSTLRTVGIQTTLTHSFAPRISLVSSILNLNSYLRICSASVVWMKLLNLASLSHS